MTLPDDETVAKYNKHVQTPLNLAISNLFIYLSNKLLDYCNTFLMSMGEIKSMNLPVCTLSPICSSEIATDFVFSRITLAVDGKQSPPPDGGG